MHSTHIVFHQVPFYTNARPFHNRQFPLTRELIFYEYFLGTKEWIQDVSGHLNSWYRVICYYVEIAKGFLRG